jgi:hypothetical protein
MVGMALLILPGACVYGILKDRKLRRERYYGTPLEDARMRVALDEECLEVEGGGSVTRVPWSALRRASSFQDGWLLEESDGPRWLPRAGLSGAEAWEVDVRLAAHGITSVPCPRSRAP